MIEISTLEYWTIITLAFMAGGFVGVISMALFCAMRRDDDQDEHEENHGI